MSIESERLQTPTDVLITVMEDADELDKILVMAVFKDGSCGSYANFTDITYHLGMVEAHKARQLAKFITPSVE